MADSAIPSTMRAWQYLRTNGGLEKNLRMNPSAPLPKPKSNQHLVRIAAAALNPVDYKPAEVPGITRFVISKPATPAIDFAGSIVKPASGSSLKPGQLVFGASGTSPLAGGALADFNAAQTASVAVLPEGVSLTDAATVGVAGLTAYQSIVPYVKKGDRIFINGGSGGTGAFGIQFARTIGCHITTTCSTTNIDLCKRLGADEVIDYRKENVIEALKAKESKFDHAVDNVGTDHEMIWSSHQFMQPGAAYIVVGGGATLGDAIDGVKRKIWPTFLGGIKGKVMGFWPRPTVEDLQQIVEWIRTGKVKPLIDEKFPFEQAPHAMEKLKTGRAKGKIVIDVNLNAFKQSS